MFVSAPRSPVVRGQFGKVFRAGIGAESLDVPANGFLGFFWRASDGRLRTQEKTEDGKRQLSRSFDAIYCARTCLWLLGLLLMACLTSRWEARILLTPLEVLPDSADACCRY